MTRAGLALILLLAVLVAGCSVLKSAVDCGAKPDAPCAGDPETEEET